jgi:hypothetical protein
MMISENDEEEEEGRMKTNAEGALETSEERVFESLHERIASAVVTELEGVHGDVDKIAEDGTTLGIFVGKDQRDDPL